MEEISIKIPDELKELALSKRINWQLLISKRINEELEGIARLKRGLSKSRLTEKDVQELSDEVNASLSERYSELLKSKVE